MRIDHTLRVLLLEDDPITAMDLKEILGLSGFEVVGICNSYEKAVEAYERLNVDVLLVDVQLVGEKTGIDFVKYVRESNKNSPVVYLTANSDMVTKNWVFDTDPEVFLTKPFTEKNVVVSLELAFNKFCKHHKTSEMNCLFIKSGDRMLKVEVSQILYLQADGSYTRIVTDSKELLQSSNLSYFESKLHHSFIRIHRSYLVNMERIHSIDMDGVHLGEITLPIGRKYRENIRRMMI